MEDAAKNNSWTVAQTANFIAAKERAQAKFDARASDFILASEFT
jgi:hypothetical protein